MRATLRQLLTGTCFLPPTAYCLLLTADRSPLQARHPDTPFIMYIAKSAALLERMAATGEHHHSKYKYSQSQFSHRFTNQYLRG